ncbi:TIGR04255 family protein [Inquilinus sp. CA228]|uniref:TIGR04255 family protein n=1 Tax=Inquilinus sp. CA228 TaxID=3455609 RepID=UPI003F8D4449
MEMRDTFDPLFGAERKEIPLAAAPLARVVAQVRFAEIVSIEKRAFIAEFQEAIRGDYPRFAGEEVQVVVGVGMQPDIRRDQIWRFYDDQGIWRVSLTSNFVALETTAYESRSDFMERFRAVLDALARTIAPTHVNRIGVRYVDHIRSPHSDDMDEMVNPQMLGLVTSDLREHIQHSISETLCEVAEGQLLARWGLLPPDGTHDPAVMPAADKQSWFLDLDVFQEHGRESVPYDSARLQAVGLALATRAYSFFRWATTDKFISAYGGKS